jgi:hypothetical protein
VSVADLLGAGVIGDGRLRLTPAGGVPTQAADNVTGELKPFSEVTLTIIVWFAPAISVTERGCNAIEKSGTPTVVVLSFTSGAVTVKLAEAESPLGLLVAVIVYRPVVTFATSKDADSTPLESEQFAEATTSPKSVQFASVEGKPIPETWIPAPMGADDSLSDIDIGEVVTVNVCEAQSPSGVPVTVIV